jgi:hypothetical protein
MDEMDLMKKLRDVPSPHPDAYDSARAALHAAMAEPVPTVVRPKRWFSWPKVSVAAVGAAAVAAAVVMGTMGTNAPVSNPIAVPQVVDSPLMKLASDVKAGPLSGDSSLVIITKPAPDGSPYVVYTVYTDKGQVFHGDSPKTLQSAATKSDDSASPFDSKVMQAARLAATGDVEKAKIAMVNASPNGLGLGLSPAEQEKAWAQSYEATAKMLREMGKQVPEFKPRPTGKELEDAIGNRLWSNTTYALFIGAANTEIRAGVLKLVATMKDVSVGKAQVDGQSALTLTAGPALQGGESTNVVTINADTGLPIRSETIAVKDGKRMAADYRSSRVNLADIVAGRI